VSTHCRILLAGLYILPQGTLLQIETSPRIEDMQVYNRMQQLAPIMTLATGGMAYHMALFINKRE
jgi:hypothetical protein